MPDRLPYAGVPQTDAVIQRKLNEECVRGCGQPAAEDSFLCLTHRDADRERYRLSKQRIRKRRKEQRLCVDCGGPRPRGRASCMACAVRHGRVMQRYRKSAGASKDERIAAATMVHPDGRERYHGQRKRGNQPHLQLDEQDIGYAQSMLERGLAGLRLYESAEVQALPRIQREDVRAEALALLNRATGHTEDVLERRKFFEAKPGHFQSRHGRRG